QIEPVCLAQLRDRALVLVVLVECATEQLADLGVLGAVREVLERLERLLDAPLAGCALRVVEEPAPRVGQEPLGRAELPELAQQVEVFGSVAERLVAEGDRVVVEAGISVAIRRLRVVSDSLRRAADPDVQVADAVVERELDVAFTLTQLEHTLVGLDRLVPVFAQLVSAGVVLELVRLLHASPASEPA